MSSHKYSLTELRNLQEDDELDLSASQIREFPNAIVQLARLTKLDMSSNSLTFLPENFCKMTRIIRLDFGNNQLDHLPDAIGQLTSLQHLNLYNNKLEDLPLSFSNLKSLKWLDLKKNPLNPKLLAVAGNCGSDAECKVAAKQVVEVYMGERQKAIENQKAQEAKLQAKVQKAKEAEKIRKHQEKKKKELEEKNEKDAKQHRESGASTAKAQHQPAAQQKANHKNHKDDSPKHKKDGGKKCGQKPRGFFCGLFSFIWSCIFYLTLILATSSTVAIVLDCKGLGSKIPGNAPLCKDLTLLASGTKPSAAFGQNLKSSYGQLFNGYHNQVKPHVAPVQKWISQQWSKFVKTDIGKKVEQVLYKIHAFVVDVWVKVQRFVVKQWNTIVAWWKKDGQKQFGPALDGFMIGLKMVFNIVVDIARNVATLFLHLIAKVKTFFLAWSDGGFNAAMNTLNH